MCPMRCSTLSPKIHRKSMLPARCSHPPCMNMLVSSVSQIGVGPGSCGIWTVVSPTVISGLHQVDPVGDLVRHGAVAVGEVLAARSRRRPGAAGRRRC